MPPPLLLPLLRSSLSTRPGVLARAAATLRPLPNARTPPQQPHHHHHRHRRPFSTTTAGNGNGKNGDDGDDDRVVRGLLRQVQQGRLSVEAAARALAEAAAQVCVCVRGSDPIWLVVVGGPQPANRSKSTIS